MPEPVKEYHFFLFSNIKLYPATYMYFIAEKIILIILAYVVVTQESEYREAVMMFFLLMVADLADFLLCYNEVWWFTSGGIPVSMNIVKVFIFTLVIIKEVWKQRIS